MPRALLGSPVARNSATSADFETNNNDGTTAVIGMESTSNILPGLVREIAYSCRAGGYDEPRDTDLRFSTQ